MLHVFASMIDFVDRKKIQKISGICFLSRHPAMMESKECTQERVSGRARGVLIKGTWTLGKAMSLAQSVCASDQITVTVILLFFFTYYCHVISFYCF